MQNQARNSYQQSEILDADPKRLVVLLYRGAIEATARAREHQLRGEIRDRSAQITRAFDIVSELAASLDLEKGGELALRLLKLYDYAQHELLRANAEQSAEILAQVEATLRSLAEAWEALAAQTATPPALIAAYGQESARKSISYSV